MKHILGSEYRAFEDTFSHAPIRGIHLNPMRYSEEKLIKCKELQLERINFIKSGFYLCENSPVKLGSHPLHHGGAIYSQDPSAMLPISGLSISSDWRVLDLCAAPGGKSSQIASRLSGNGFLLCNEPNPARNKILISNIERMGYPNVLVTKLSPDEIASYYPCYFHMVLVDAPCSGEGMFRKYPESINEWSPEQVLLCQQRQKDILNSAVNTLLPGGLLVYSTCTYSVEENEDIVSWLIHHHHMEPAAMPNHILSVTAPPLDGPANCQRRAYPHLYQGEGQFMAYLRKPGVLPAKADCVSKSAAATTGKASSQVITMIKQTLNDNFDLNGLSFYEHSEQDHKKIFVLPAELAQNIPPHGITLCGVTAGVIDRKRYIPHHHFLHAYGHLCRNTLNLFPDDPCIYQYLNGQELENNSVSKGYGILSYDGCPIGGFKASGGRLKNHYPKALRSQILPDHL